MLHYITGLTPRAVSLNEARKKKKGRPPHHITNPNLTPMGYIQDLEAELNNMLSALDEAKRTSVIKYVKEKVWQSYKNGKAEADKNGGNAPKSKQATKKYGR